MIIVKRLDKKALISDPSLLVAARENNIDLVRTLLEQRANPNITDSMLTNGFGSVNTALHLAAENKDDNKGLVELLLEYGADIDSQNKYGSTCLMYAAFNNNIKIVHCLLQNGADIHRKNKLSENVLHYAAKNQIDNKFIIELLIEYGADIDSQEENGYTCLMTAARHNKIEIFRCLLQNGADINRKNKSSENVLHYAARNKDGNYFLFELLKNGADIDSQDRYGETCLMKAADYNNIEIVRCLLQHGADINRKNSGGYNALHYSAKNKNKFIIELLLEYGVDIDSQDEYGSTCLMYAAFNYNIEIVRCLLQNGADIHRKNKLSENVLHYAAKNKFDDKFIIGLLIEYGADIDSQDEYSSTCLMTAAENNKIEIVRILLQNGADINRKNKSSENVLHYAARNKKDNKLIIELLLKNGADINNQNKDGETCLMKAALYNNIEIARCLLQNGADINKQNIFCRTAIQIAKSNGKNNKEIVELLVDYEREKSIKKIQPGNNRNVIIVKHLDKNSLISNPRILSAARENNIDLVRTLLEQCADPNIKDDYDNTAQHLAACNKEREWLVKIFYRVGSGNTALHFAAENKDDNKGLVELLLEYGADIDSQNDDGVTCLMTAARNNNIEIVRCLLQNDADIHRKNKLRENVLHYAAQNKIDNKFIIELLIEYGANIDSQNENGETCLMRAAISNLIEIFRCLLQNGADINRNNKSSENVLHYAARNENDNKLIIELLLKNGADIDSQNKNGSTCLMWAARNNNIEIVRCLLQNGADINKKDIDGANVLYYAAENKNDNKFIIELLLEYGADKDSKIKYDDNNYVYSIYSQNLSYGQTCLMYAAINNNIEIVRCLLQNGADINKKDRNGETAIQIAKSNGKDNKEIVELLLYYERKSKPSFLTKIFKFIIGKK